MTKATSRMRCGTVLLAAILLAGAPDVRADENGTPVLPTGSLGYVHLQLDEMSETPQARVFNQLLSHVAAESSLLSIEKLGLDVTSVTDLTLVVPPFNQLLEATGSGDYPMVVLARFSKSFRSRQLGSHLAGWSPQSVGNNGMYVREDGAALHIASNRMLVIGTSAAVQWWLQSESQEGSGTLTQLLVNSESGGQLLFGLDLQQIPNPMVQQLLPLASWVADADFASLDIVLDDTIALNGYLEFGSEEQAKTASDELLKLGRLGLEELAKIEADLKPQVRQGDTGSAVSSLFALALLRQCAESLEDVEVSHDEVNAMVSAELDAHLLFMTAFGAVGVAEIGRQGNADFESVVEQLEE